jgi:hypothetical protein
MRDVMILRASPRTAVSSTFAALMIFANNMGNSSAANDHGAQVARDTRNHEQMNRYESYQQLHGEEVHIASGLIAAEQFAQQVELHRLA